ncbi:cardioacceleratory peptide receptor-like [Cryptotermes secundus]|uniref:cardioacceleratory peptide receptor-like n=1 Tax=Cryptotermes secundus TaxID=105785 RepID=UPI001454C8E6|nr:cardioacceleratory peptide receptor-like [Cryptotermes secundus]
MDTAPADLNCSWSDGDASGNIVIFSSTATTAAAAAATIRTTTKTTEKFNSICFSDTEDYNNVNDTYSHNITQSQTQDINSFYFYETEQFAVLWILFALIVLGNASVLLALFMSKKRKSRMNFFIMQLALADLFVGLISVMTDIIWRITVAWNAGNVACKLIRFLQCVVTYSSTYVLVALSIDRYDAVTHPMNFSGSWRRARLLVTVAWIISAVFSVPIVVLYRETPIQGRLQCWIDFSEQWQWQLYMTLVAVTLFVVPAVIISACYAIIVTTIWSTSKQLTPDPNRRQSRNSGSGSGSSSSYVRTSGKHRMLRLQQLQQEDHDSRRASSRGIIPKAKVKTIKMTFVIVFVFVTCWSPYIVFDLLQVYGHVPRTQTNIAVASFIQSLAPLNSAANPLIYCLFSTSVGRTLRKKAPFSWLAAALGACCPTSVQSRAQHDAGENMPLADSTRWSSQRRKTHRPQHPHIDAMARGAAVAAVVTIV